MQIDQLLPSRNQSPKQLGMVATPKTIRQRGYLAAGLAALLAWNSAECRAEDWTRFRGANGSGIAGKLELEDGLSEEDILWKQEVAAGTSSPIVRDDKLFYTSFEGTQRTLHCVDSKSGARVWEVSIESVRKEAATPPNGPATCTPSCDDRHIAAFFPDAGLVVCSLQGEKKWSKDLGPFSSMHGLSASPILYEGLVILCVDQLADPYIVALDVATGEEKWKTERLIGITGGYSTPTLMKVDGKTLLISAAPAEMVAYDPATGEKLASVEGLTNAPVSVPVVVENQVFFSEPPGEPIPMEALGNADKNGDKVIELDEVKGSVGATRLIQRLDSGFGNGDGKVDQQEWDKGFGTFLNRGGFACVTFQKHGNEWKGELQWKYNKATPYIPSSLVVSDTAYIINDGGILMAFDTKSGEMLQRERVSNATGGYYASPVAGQDKMVLANLEGKVTLVQTGRPFKVLKTYNLAEPIVATPSIANGKLYIRSQGHLYCFAKKPS